jgi:proteic killer suppression protein
VGLRFKHKGLHLLYERDDPRKLNPNHIDKLKNVLARLDVARTPADTDLTGFKLHRLKGSRVNTWSVTVRANWRVTFRWDGDDIVDIDYEDYH